MGKRSGRAPANERGPRGKGRGLRRGPGGAEGRGSGRAGGGGSRLVALGLYSLLGGFVCLLCFSLRLGPLFSAGLSSASALWEPTLLKAARL